MMNDDRTTEMQELLARNVRRQRIARHLSLSELARLTGVSKATLSSIENKRANPTVETLSDLAGALRISLVELLAEAPLGDVRIVRAARPAAKVRDGIPRRLLDSIALEGALEVAEMALAARQMHEADAGASGSRAHVYVLQGKLIAGPVERITELGPGDFASFPADGPHVYEAGRQPARALLLTYTPS